MSRVLAVPLIVLVVLPLLAHRGWPSWGADGGRLVGPAAVFLLAAGVSFAEGRLIPQTAPATIAGILAALLLGHLADGRQAAAGLAIVLAGAGIIVHNGPAHAAGDFLFTPALFAIAWLAGFALRERAAQAAAAEERAELAERERAAAARVAVAEERARIARELHDVVAHALSVIVLHAGAVRHGLPDGLTDAKDALRGVEQTGRTALADMRRLLGALRRDDERPDLAPRPGLGGLDALAEEFRRAGLPVLLRRRGEPSELPPTLDLAAYRIVQEGLTNALKHARPSAVAVVVAQDGDQITIEVTNDGAVGPVGDGRGYGLLGIEERVKIYGGELTAGPTADGGFRLSARLPLRAALDPAVPAGASAGNEAAGAVSGAPGGGR
ncbi:MAG: sensor histidine kinase [Frankia sp.]|nr:sensor histidine kinase [Frankia sp.]